MCVCVIVVCPVTPSERLLPQRVIGLLARQSVCAGGRAAHVIISFSVCFRYRPIPVIHYFPSG